MRALKTNRWFYAHPPQEIGAKVRLGKGLHPIRIAYFEATGESILELFLKNAAGERTKLGEGAFFHASTQK